MEKGTNKPHLKNRDFIISLIYSFILLAISLFINYHAGNYATNNQSNWVEDIVLDNIRTYNVEFVFVYGTILFWLGVLFLSFTKPHKIPFTFKSISLFIIIRSIFITLTHIGAYPEHIPIPDHSLISKFTFGGDLFFSGHTGLPFLLMLIYWEHPAFRYVFMALSFVFGIVVLMGHLHYTIDVLSAFFITYTIYHIALKFFPKDKETFEKYF